MKEIVRGIIVNTRNFNENDLLISVVLENSKYVRGYMKEIRKDNLQRNSNSACAIGQQVVMIMYIKDNSLPHFYLDSIENSLIYLFLHNHEKLEILNKIFKYTNRIPENTEYENLYDNFLHTIKLVAQDHEEAYRFWSDCVDRLIS